MTNEEKTKQWLVELGKGIEIGAWLNPLPNIEPIYVDLFEEFAGQKCNVDILSEPTDLPFENGQLDYVASSHVIEHIVNPIRALVEWTRITRHNGILYLVIPDRKFTWERNRPVVQADHLLDDYNRKTTQSDGTHIDEFLDTLVWEEFSPDDSSEAAREAFRERLHHAIEHDLDINIHFHAFESDTFSDIVDVVNRVLPEGERLELVDHSARFPRECPNGFLAVLQVHRPEKIDRWRKLLDRFRFWT